MLSYVLISGVRRCPIYLMTSPSVNRRANQIKHLHQAVTLCKLTYRTGAYPYTPMGICPKRTNGKIVNFPARTVYGSKVDLCNDTTNDTHSNNAETNMHILLIM